MTRLSAEHLAAIRPPGPGNWSPAGDHVAYFWADRSGITRLWVAAVDRTDAWHVTAPPVVVEPADGTDRRDVMGGPQWSPMGDRIAFTAAASAGKGRAIWAIDITTKAATELTHTISDARTARWSPDGSRIAFVGSRDGRDELMVTQGADRPPQQLTYGRWDNTDPEWSPDGQHIVYISQRSDDDLFSHAIFKVSVEAGRPLRLTGDVICSDRSPRWSPSGDRIAFISNRDGGDNVWVFQSDGSDLRQLTYGNSEKADPRWSPDGRWVVFTCFRDCHIDIMAVSIDGGAPRPVVIGEVNQFPRWSSDGTQLLYHRSGHASPGDLWIKRWDSLAEDPGARVTHVDGQALDGIEFVRPSVEKYRSSDGLEIQGLLFRGRRDDDDASGPGILYVRGGPNFVNVVGWSPQIQYLAQRGYTLFAPNYRGSTGYGKAFMEANRGHVPGADIDDWLAAKNVLCALPEVDCERVGIMGRSYGGYATLLMLGLHPRVFKVGVAISGVSDWQLYWDSSANSWSRRLVAWLMQAPHANLPEHRARSPMSYVERYAMPVLLIHGEADYGVTPAQSRVIAHRLEQLGKPNEYYVYPGEGHAFTGATALIDSALRIERFLATHLARKVDAVESFVKVPSGSHATQVGDGK